MIIVYVSAVPNLLANLINVLDQFFHLRVSVGGKTPNEQGIVRYASCGPRLWTFLMKPEGWRAKFGRVASHRMRIVTSMICY